MRIGISRKSDESIMPVVVQFVSRELKLSWHFIWRDISTTMIPALLFMGAAVKTIYPISMQALLLGLGRWAIYFWLYIYTFCLADQIGGAEEDRINKPDRPIPAAAVSLHGAVRRWVVAVGVFLLVGGWFGVWPWSLLWVVASVLHNFRGWDKHWFTKNNVIMPVGFLAEVAPAWQLVTPLTPLAWRWLLVGAFVVCVTAAVQDFRDITGDRATGRRTLPVILGQKRARALMSVIFLFMPFFIHFMLFEAAGIVGKVLCDAWLGGLVMLIVYRLWKYDSAPEDHKTYMVYTYWYCSVLASAVVVM